MIKNQNKIYIIIIIFILIALMLIVFLIYPVLRDIQNGSKEILSNKSKVAFLNKQRNELNGFNRKYNNDSYDLERIDQLFVDSKNPIDFVEFLEKTANDSGITMDIKLNISLLDKGFNKWPVAISNIAVTGEFFNILKFSEKLNTSPYLMMIKNITIKKSQQVSAVDANFLVEAITK